MFPITKEVFTNVGDSFAYKSKVGEMFKARIKFRFIKLFKFHIRVGLIQKTNCA